MIDEGFGEVGVFTTTDGGLAGFIAGVSDTQDALCMVKPLAKCKKKVRE